MPLMPLLECWLPPQIVSLFFLFFANSSVCRSQCQPVHATVPQRHAHERMGTMRLPECAHTWAHDMPTCTCPHTGTTCPLTPHALPLVTYVHSARCDGEATRLPAHTHAAWEWCDKRAHLHAPTHLPTHVQGGAHEAQGWYDRHVRPYLRANVPPPSAHSPS